MENYELNKYLVSYSKNGVRKEAIMFAVDMAEIRNAADVNGFEVISIIYVPMETK